MTKRFAFVLTVATIVAVPMTNSASADDGPGVNEVSMRVDARTNGKDTWSPGGRELHWAGAKCPLRIQFKGEVLVDRVTKITYRWERSDGTVLPTQTFDVTKPDALVDVAPPDGWDVGAPGKTFRGAETFHVLTPNEMTITTPVRVECQ
jgi:hypothetical protein